MRVIDGLLLCCARQGLTWNVNESSEGTLIISLNLLPSRNGHSRGRQGRPAVHSGEQRALGCQQGCAPTKWIF